MTNTISIAQLSQSQPLQGAKALDARVYASTEFAEIEKLAIFKASWQYVGHTSQLSQIGDLLVTNVADVPLIVIRNETGIQCFANVCQHRAGPLATENGTVRNLRCLYHGWTYDLSGTLIIAPEMDESFPACDIKLTEYPCEEWQGFIFVHLGSVDQTVTELFTGISEQITPIDLQQMSFHHRDSYEVACNWKVYMDNYLEGYHLPYVHPGLSKLLDYRQYDTELFKWYSYQSSPLQASDNFYGNGDAHYYSIYPNLMLNILPGRCQLNLVTPVGLDRCRVDFDYFYSDLESAETARLIEQDLAFSDEIQQEDIDICELVQKGLNSGTYRAGYLCQKREQGVWHFQELIRAAYRRWLTAQ